VPVGAEYSNAPIQETTMNEIKRAMAVMLALTAGAAYAQTPSSVTLYGVIDTGVERVSNANGTSSSLIRMPSQTGGHMGSRWGVRGTEDLGDGLKALFVLESGFAPDKGSNTTNQGGRLFGRQAFVGLGGSWGTLTLGRQYTMYLMSMIEADVIGPGVFGLGSFDPGLPGGRSDNTLAYTGRFNGFTLGAGYSLGRDAVSACAGEVAGDAKACRQYSLMGKYDSAAWGVALSRDEQRGGPAGTGGLNASNLSDKRTAFAGYFKPIDTLKLSAGLVKRHNQGVSTTTVTPKSSMPFVGLTYTVVPALTVDGLWSQLKYSDSTDGSKASMVVVRATYALSKRTGVYVTSGRLSNKGSSNLSISGGATPADANVATPAALGPGAGRSQTGFMIGVRHSF